METNDRMTCFGQRYAQAYDSFYDEKDYGAECNFLQAVFQRWGNGTINRILDLGCGTSGHGLCLARRGLTVVGVDRSPSMLALARAKAQAEGLDDRVQFAECDIRELPTWHTHLPSTNRAFDAAICMFAVLSYQTSHQDLLHTLRGTREVLAPGGLFVADFWFGPAVLRQRPEPRTKVVLSGDSRFERTAEPSWSPELQTVSVHYQLRRWNGSQLVDECEESHTMRYLFFPELRELMDAAGFEVLHECVFPMLDVSASDEHWNAAIVARRIEREPADQQSARPDLT